MPLQANITLLDRLRRATSTRPVATPRQRRTQPERERSHTLSEEPRHRRNARQIIIIDDDSDTEELQRAPGSPTPNEENHEVVADGGLGEHGNQDEGHEEDEEENRAGGQHHGNEDGIGEGGIAVPENEQGVGPRTPQKFQDGFQNIPFFGLLKGDNPFWVSEKEEFVEQERYHLLNFNRTIPALPLAFYNGPMQEEVQHEDRAIGHVAKTVFFCHGQLNWEIGHHYVLSSRITKESEAGRELYNSWQTKTKGAQRDFQFRYLSVVRRGVHALAGYYAENDKPLNTASKEERLALWSAYFNQDPKFLTSILYLHVQTGIDLHGIYREGGDQPALRCKWRDFIKKIFTAMCENMYEVREAEDLIMMALSDNKKATLLRRRWQECHRALQQELGLGVDKVPVPSGWRFNGGKAGKTYPGIPFVPTGVENFFTQYI